MHVNVKAAMVLMSLMKTYTFRPGTLQQNSVGCLQWTGGAYVDIKQAFSLNIYQSQLKFHHNTG